jgi:hypothetical protein
MSVATAEPALATRKLARSAGRLFEPSGSTLEDMVLGAWEDLTARGHAECPVCHSDELEPSGCARCGSELT